MNLDVALVLKAIDKATAPLRGVQASLAKVSDAAKRGGETFEKYGEKASAWGANVTAFAQKAQAAIESILAPTNDLENAMAELSVAFPDKAMVASLDRVRQASIAWSQEHTQSASQYVATAKLLMQAGIGQAHALEATAAALRLATATGGDATAVARTLGIVFSQMADKTKDPVAELGRLSDALARAKQLFPSLDIANLTDPLKEAIPAAKQAGVAFEQLIATLGQLNKAGLQGGEAGAALAKIINAMGPASKSLGFNLVKGADGGLDLVATLRQIESKFGSIDKMSPATKAKLEQAFGPDVWKSLMLLIGQTGDLEEALKKLKNSSGAASEAQKKLEATTAAQAKIASQSWDALKIQLAAGVAPALVETLRLVRLVIGYFSRFADAHPDLVKTAGKVLVVVAAVTAIVGPVLAAGGAVLGFAGFLLGVVVPALIAATTAAAAFAVALLANPITWIVLAVVAAAVLIYVYWGPISGFFIRMWARITAAFNAAALIARTVWDAARGALAGIFEEIRAAFQVSFVGGIHKAIYLLQPGTIIGRVFAAVRPILAQVWFGVRTDIYAAGDAVIAAVGAWWQGVLRAMATFGTEVRMVLREAWIGLRTDLYDALGSVGVWFTEVFVGGIKTDVAEVLAVLNAFSLEQAGQNIVDTLVAGMRKAADKPAQAMQSITKSLRDYLPFSPAKVGPLRDLHRVKIVETVAEGVRPGPLVDAMAGVASAAYAALEMPTGPSLGAVPSSAAPGVRAVGAPPVAPGAASSSAPMQVTFQLLGGTAGDAVSQLEAFLRNPSNARRLYQAVQLGAGVEQRTELG